MKFFLIGLLFLSSIPVFADVMPLDFTNGSAYVRVSNSLYGVWGGGNKISPWVKFEKCFFGSEETSCQQIGPRAQYSKTSR
jgi:hypothetical protein